MRIIRAAEQGRSHLEFKKQWNERWVLRQPVICYELNAATAVRAEEGKPEATCRIVT
jgi:hypothetical protein